MIFRWLKCATVEQGMLAFIPVVKLSLFASPFIYIFEKISGWYITNDDYVLLVLGAILTDWFFGSWKHFRNKTFNLGENAKGLVLKITLTVGGGFLFEGLSHLTSTYDMLVGLTQVITRLVVFLYPALSAINNIYIVSDEKFPPKRFVDNINKFFNDPSKENLDNIFDSKSDSD